MFLSQKVLAGDVDPAIRTHTAFFSVWKRYGFTPEGFNLATLSVQVLHLKLNVLVITLSDGTMMLQLHSYLSFSLQYGQKSYPLRPELIESTYLLYKATRDPRSQYTKLAFFSSCPKDDYTTELQYKFCSSTGILMQDVTLLLVCNTGQNVLAGIVTSQM